MTPEEPSFGGIFLLGFVSLFVLYIGKRSGIFDFSESEQAGYFPITWVHVAVGFAIYFGISLILTPFLAKFLQKIIFSHPSTDSFLSYSSWLNFINSSLVMTVLFVYLKTLPQKIRTGIWRDPNDAHPPYFKHLCFAAFAWLIAFPAILFTNQILDWLLQAVFHIQQVPEQLAVYFLKMTFGHTFYLTLAILSIVVLAPFIEEILFRGLLQSYIRQNLGSRGAIFITSALFSFFHYSPEQGVSNLTIVGSLFVFSLFIGLVYEKKRTLITPIFLHALFNTINVFNLYFLGKTAKTMF